MKLIDLLRTLDREAVMRELDVLDNAMASDKTPAPDKIRAAYGGVWDELLTLEPVADEIVVKLVVEDNEEFPSAYGTAADDDTSPLAIELMPWDRWIGLEVTHEDMSPEHAMAGILWEMTFFGFDQKEIAEMHDELERDIDAIEKPTGELEAPGIAKELKFVLSPQVLAQMEADPKLAEFIEKSFVPNMQKAHELYRDGDAETREDAIEAVTGSRPEKVRGGFKPKKKEH